jgi:serine/threonine protein phosphatase 1
MWLPSDLRRALNRPAATEGDERIYAIGDIHGQFDLLKELLALIEEDNVARGRRACRIVVLGDFIDRGGGSREIVTLLRLAQGRSQRFIVLLGNHEATMLDALAGNGPARHFWLSNGGLETLASFGIDPPGLKEHPTAFARRAVEAVTPDALDWMRGLPLAMRSGNYFFCHAGVRPGVPLDRQSREDLLWIRKDFLRTRRRLGAVVVHGHSKSGRSVEFRRHRIGVDTGAYATRILSAVGLEGAARWSLSTGPKPRSLGTRLV